MLNTRRLNQVDPQVVEDIWQAGFVNRWHTHPDARLRNAQDTTAAHSQRVATLVAFIAPQLALQDLLCAIWHDVPERWTGDVARDAKRDHAGAASPLGAAVAEAEDAVWRDLEVGPPSHSRVVALCDTLDAWMFVQRVAPDVLREESWAAERGNILCAADELGVLDRVEPLLG